MAQKPDLLLECRVCGASAERVGDKHSDFSGRTFEIAQCSSCRFAFVVDPRTDFDVLYDSSYYRGEGPALHTDYESGLRDPKSAQIYEWRAILRILSRLGGLNRQTRWLDFGCGLGGLVRYARGRGFDAVGFDEGYAADRLKADGVPTIERAEFAQLRETFDIVTAVEVVEHAIDPVAMLQEISALLRPSGVLFLTTGNAAPFRGRLPEWQYVQPDVHISYFEPSSLDLALQKAGLEPEHPGYVPGFTDLIRAKVLRTLGARRQSMIERCAPWSILSRLADRRYRVTAQPIGRKPAR